MTAIGAAPRSGIRTRPLDKARSAGVRSREASPAAAPAPGIVAREELVARLAASERPLALVVAPAGYGKTALLAEWAGRDPRPFVVVRLRASDNDPLELSRSVACAFAAALPALADELGGAATASGRRALGSLSRSLDAALKACAEPWVLVLDGAHVLSTRDAFAPIERIASALGPGSQIVVASRCEPPLPISRLRTERRLFELRTPDLVLTRGEVAAVATAAGLGLDSAGQDLLAQRTEGWPVGVYLAALALSEEPSPRRALARFGGDDRFVVDYVRDELLADLSPDRIEFLARTSIITRLSGPLCDYVLERRDSSALLRELSQLNLLVVPMDRTDTDYRYHALFAQALRNELRLREPELEPELHARASIWYEAHGDRGLAIEHAAASGDLERAAELVWDEAPAQLGYGQASALVRRLARFTREQISVSPPLALSAACAHFARGDRPLAEHWTLAAQHAIGDAEIPHSMSAPLHVLRAAVTAEDVATMAAHAAAAYELSADDSPWRPYAATICGVALWLGGDSAGARRRLEEGARRGAVVAPTAQVTCLAELALLALENEEWDSAETLIAHARAQVDRVGLDNYPTAAIVFAASAAVRAQLNRPDVAEQDARHAEQLLSRLVGFAPWYTARCRVAVAFASLRLSEVSRAWRLLDEADYELRAMPDATRAHQWLLTCRQQAELVSAVRAGEGEPLTTAELRVLQYLPTHLSFPEIAARLFVSRNTVKTHVRAVYRKLTASSRSEAVQHAREAGLLDQLAA